MQPIITSSANPHFRQFKKLLTNAKARREQNLAVAEGIHLVQSFLQSGATPREYICAVSALEHPEIAELITRLAQTEARELVIADSLFTSLSSVHASVGIIICFTPPHPQQLPEMLLESAVLLEDVQDPGTIGAILRVAAAIGVRELFLSTDCASPWSPKALRAGMGAQFSVAIHENVETLDIVQQLRMPILATTLSQDSQSVYSLDLTQPVLWVFGNEGQGVSPQLGRLATTHVSIPQAINTVESLNVATATAVCLYEQYRQRHALSL